MTSSADSRSPSKSCVVMTEAGKLAADSELKS